MEGESDRFWYLLADQMGEADHAAERTYEVTLSGLRLPWDWQKRRAFRSLVSHLVAAREGE